MGLMRFIKALRTASVKPLKAISVTEQKINNLIHLERAVSKMQQQIATLENRALHGWYLPTQAFLTQEPVHKFMAHSTCNVDDFLNPRFTQLINMIHHPLCWQRKLWEWVFVMHHLLESGAVKKGSKGLVFGVGSERLPSLFASFGAKITATDAPPDIGIGSGWQDSNQFANNLEMLHYPEIVDRDSFYKNVTYRSCDMNNIDTDFNDYDFNWSSCCFEHLGSIEAGLQFIVNAVENTLKVGGVAVHTTEFNLSSNEETVTEGGTVIFRKRDIETLITNLRQRGHEVYPLSVAPNTHFHDFHVDVPPFLNNPHLKMLLGDHTTTSMGIVIKRMV